MTILERSKGVQSRPDHRPERQDRQGLAGPEPQQPQRVLAGLRERPDLLRLRERDRLRDAREGRQHRVDLPRGRRRQGRRWRSGRPALLRHVRRQRLLAGRGRASRSGARAPAAPTSASARATSTPRPRWPTDASTSATPTGTCTPSRRKRASSPGAAGRAPTSTPPPPSPRSAAASRPSTSGATTARSTRSTPGRAHPLDASATAARSPARATVIGDVVYYSNWGKRDTTGLWAKSGNRVFHSDRGAFNPVVSDGQAHLPDAASPRSARSCPRRRARGARDRKRRPRRQRRDEEGGRQEEEGRRQKKKAAAKKKAAQAEARRLPICGQGAGSAARRARPIRPDPAKRHARRDWRARALRGELARDREAAGSLAPLPSRSWTLRAAWARPRTAARPGPRGSCTPRSGRSRRAAPRRRRPRGRRRDRRARPRRRRR